MPNVTRTALPESAVVIRRATPDDREALARLAALDSARPLHGTVLVAESDRVIRAAYAVETRRAIADPFAPTAALVDLLEIRAARLRETPGRRRAAWRMSLSAARS